MFTNDVFRNAGNRQGARRAIPRYDTSAGTYSRRHSRTDAIPQQRDCIRLTWWTGPLLVDRLADPALARADLRWTGQLVLQPATGAVLVVAAALRAQFARTEIERRIHHGRHISSLACSVIHCLEFESVKRPSRS